MTNGEIFTQILHEVTGQPKAQVAACIDHIWLGKEAVSLPPPPRRTGRATRAAPSSSSSSKVPGLRLHTVYKRCSRVTFTRLGSELFLWMSALLLVLATSHPATSAPFRGGYDPIRRVMSSPCLSAAGLRFLAVLCPLWIWPSLAMRLLDRSRPQRGCHVPHRQAVSGELASLRRERGTVSTGPLTSVDHGSRKDVSTTFVP
jgi:hypothetical protein